MSGVNSVEDYVHRIGRTARGGNTGTAFTFLTSTDLKNGAAVKELVGVLTRCNQVSVLKCEFVLLVMRKISRKVVPEELSQIVHELERNKSYGRSSNTRIGGGGRQSLRDGDGNGGGYRRRDERNSFSVSDGGGYQRDKEDSRRREERNSFSGSNGGGYQVDQDGSRRRDERNSFPSFRSSRGSSGDMMNTRSTLSKSRSSTSSDYNSGKRSSWLDKYFNDSDGDDAGSRRFGSSNFVGKRVGRDRKYSF